MWIFDDELPLSELGDPLCGRRKKPVDSGRRGMRK
jgi:hypothetical protein